MRPISRREFLILAGKGLLAAELIRLLPFLPRDFAPVPARAEGFPLAAVATGVDEDTPESILKTALDGIGGIERFVRPGMTVAIKPNATWAYPPHTASSSDPEVLRALIGMVRNAGAGKIIVLDHCSIDPGTAESLRVSGIGKVVKEEGVEGIFPDRTNAPLSTYTSIELPNGKAFKKVGVIKAAVEADLRINLALAKTHNVTKITMCLKHMMGFLQVPGRLHSALDQGVADLSTPSPIQAQLHILEALRVRLPYGSYRVCAGPETEITNPRVVKRVNQMIAGTDPVLIDSYAAANYFDTQPEEVPYIVNAFEAGVGMMDLQTAMQDGQIKVFSVGAAIPTSTPVPQPTSTAQPAANMPQPASVQPTSSQLAGTATPLPTATPMLDNGQPVGIHLNPGSGAATAEELVDPRPFLNKALIPVAGIVAGAGMVAAAQLNRSKEKDGAEPQGNEHGKEV